MTIKKLVRLFLLSSFIFLFISCKQNIDSKEKLETTTKIEQVKETKIAQHPYGGWSCPDNVFGFPAVNIQELDKVPVVTGRLPTKEETQNGSSLMYIDSEKYPNARPLDINLPKLARYYSKYTKKNELVIVIQVVIVENDTVAGFRYLNGGNGSSWYNEVNFISNEEINKLGATPFVSESIDVEVPREKIWEIITSPIYAKTLGKIFDENAFVESEWQQGSKVYFKYEPNMIVSIGEITALWKDTYIQVDYDFDGYHYAEKFLLSEDKEKNTQSLNVVAGPYNNEDFDAQAIVWKNWLQKVKELSETHD